MVSHVSHPPLEHDLLLRSVFASRPHRLPVLGAQASFKASVRRQAQKADATNARRRYTPGQHFLTPVIGFTLSQRESYVPSGVKLPPPHDIAIQILPLHIGVAESV